MITDELVCKLNSLQSIRASSNDGKNIVTPLLEIFQEFLTSLTNQFDKFKDDMLAITKSKDDEIRELINETKAKDQTIITLRNQIDSQDQYVRRETLVFSGDSIPTSRKGEDCLDMICKLIPDKLGADITVTPNDISVAHRLGPKPKAPQEDRRSIIVRFCRRNLKYAVLNKSRKAKRKDFHANESLSPTRLKIVRSLKKCKIDHPNIISGYQTVDGSIYVWVKPPNPEAEGATCSRVKINTPEEFDEFCLRNFQSPASTFFPQRRDPTQEDVA